jgi:pSer/pThr/pTyr-binding forkhead associated (FHA) protein
VRDGLTERKPAPTPNEGMEGFLSRKRAKLVVLAGDRMGTEFALERESVILGRGPNVDLAFEDSAMSRQHAVIEFVDQQFRIRDLGSTNGTLRNGRPVQVCELQNGDRVEIGSQQLQLVIEETEPVPDTYVLPSL